MNNIKVLITGKHHRMQEEVELILSSLYTIKSFKGESTDILNILNDYQPNVIILCLENESLSSIMRYSILRKYGHIKEVHIMVIGNDFDCQMFSDYSFISTVKFFNRPLNVSKLLIEVESCKEICNFKNQIKTDREEKEREELVITQTIVKDLNRKRVLIIDDDKDTQYTLNKFLYEYFDTIVVSNGRLAFMHMEKCIPDLVILDYMMPNEDGLSIYKKMRKNMRTQNIPIIFLTSVMDKEVVMDILAQRPQGYMIKPVKKSELVAKIIEIFDEIA